MAHLYSLFDFYTPYGNFSFILVLVPTFSGSLNLLFHNLSIYQFSRKNPSLAQFIPRIYNKIIIKILGYFWGVTLQVPVAAWVGGLGEEYYVAAPVGIIKEDLQQIIEAGMQVCNRNYVQSIELVR